MLDLQPFPSWPQYSLNSFPEYLKAVRADPSIKTAYLDANPIHSALLACAWNILWTWGLGEITGNVSQVDRVWNFLPIIYTFHFVAHPVLTQYLSLSLKKRPHTPEAILEFILTNVDPRQALALATQLIWSARLSYNAARRGFWNPMSEDYRWPIFRDMLPTWAFKIFNLGFIAIFQNLLLLAIALPSYYLLVQAHPATYHAPKMNAKIAGALSTPPHLLTSDYILAGLAVACVFGEFIADGQQQAYQSWKHTSDSKRSKVGQWSLLPFGLGPKIRWGDADRKRGFVSQGLWKYSRHPAFALEQTFWWLQAFFPVLPLLTGLPSSLLDSFNKTKSIEKVALQAWDRVIMPAPWWAFGGAIGLSALFVGSTVFTEYISSPKYPLYSKAYKRRVGMFWPIQTYFKRVWISVFSGNEARISAEKDLGWWKRVKGKKD